MKLPQGLLGEKERGSCIEEEIRLEVLWSLKSSETINLHTNHKNEKKGSAVSKQGEFPTRFVATEVDRPGFAIVNHNLGQAGNPTIKLLFNEADGERRVDGTCSCLIVVQDYLASTLLSAYKHKPCTEIHT